MEGFEQIVEATPEWLRDNGLLQTAEASASAAEFAANLEWWLNENSGEHLGGNRYLVTNRFEINNWLDSLNGRELRKDYL